MSGIGTSIVTESSFPMAQSRDEGTGWGDRVRDCSMGMRFPLGAMKMWLHNIVNVLKPLDVHFKMVKVSNFMLREILPQYFFKCVLWRRQVWVSETASPLQHFTILQSHSPHPGLCPKPFSRARHTPQDPGVWGRGRGRAGRAGSRTAEVSLQLNLRPHLDFPPVAFSSLSEAGGRASPKRTQVFPMPCHGGYHWSSLRLSIDWWDKIQSWMNYKRGMLWNRKRRNWAPRGPFTWVTTFRGMWKRGNVLYWFLYKKEETMRKGVGVIFV